MEVVHNALKEPTEKIEDQEFPSRDKILDILTENIRLAKLQMKLQKLRAERAIYHVQEIKAMTELAQYKSFQENAEKAEAENNKEDQD